MGAGVTGDGKVKMNDGRSTMEEGLEEYAWLSSMQRGLTGDGIGIDMFPLSLGSMPSDREISFHSSNLKLFSFTGVVPTSVQELSSGTGIS